MSIVNILDTGGAISLASADALDLLVAGGRRVVVTQQVLDEIADPTGSYYVKVRQWLSANPTLWERVVVPINQTDLDKYTITV